jgi:hypothetical protein
VAGGLQTDPTIFEASSSGQKLTKLVVLPGVVPEQMSSQVLDMQRFYFPPAGLNVSPSSVERYVLTCTFLI